MDTFSFKEYINFADEYADLVSFIRSAELSSLDPKDVIKYAKRISDETFSIIVVEEFDTGRKSPFEIKRFVAYSLSSEDGVLNSIGEGVCHYSQEISPLVKLLPILILFVASITIPIVSRLVGLINIPENCLDGMTYLIAPLAFIVGLVIPFLLNIILDFAGLELPEATADLFENLPLIVVLVGIFRMSPMIGMVTFCIKANLYTEYLREKWFLFIVTIGGALGNMSWLILGMLMELSYSGTGM